MWTSLGARPVAALTELLEANSTWGRCKSQSSCHLLTTIASIWAILWFDRSTPSLQLG